MKKIDFISYFDEVFSRLLVALKDDLHFLDGRWLYCRPEERSAFLDGGWLYCRPEGRPTFFGWQVVVLSP